MFTAAGVRGLVRVGYHDAYILGRWSLIRADATLGACHATVQARADASHAFWATQRPTSAWLDMGHAWWGWFDISLVRDGQSVTVILRGDPVCQEFSP